jgi:hypothetical protein
VVQCKSKDANYLDRWTWNLTYRDMKARKREEVIMSGFGILLGCGIDFETRK